MTGETKQRQKKFGNDVMSENSDIIAIFPIYGQFGVIRKPDSGCIVSTTFIFINSNLYFTKAENRTKVSLTALTLLLWVKVLFWPKNADFLQKKKNADISKIKKVLVLTVYFLKLHMDVYLRAKFKISSIIQRVVDKGGGFVPAHWSSSNCPVPVCQ